MSEVNVSEFKSKRQRGKNFTEWEKDMLIDLILPFKSIIENMKTDAVWNQKKTEAWSKITCLYNMQQKSGIRIDVQLKHLYDGLKRDARKEKSHDKVQRYITGGGTHIPSISKSTEKIFGLLGEQLDPLNNVVDCDGDYNTGHQSVDVEDALDDGTSNDLYNSGSGMNK
ncbi:uncharacterized protein LOC126553788 isoform X1 [Aphis gossypii]|uniref:uncharacterized protein LOC126553788 isoform X1 n=1 Tax=Aphis gossypii TaxID=80765 RepID=UPI0021593FF7|nr:uncharacterized protein LOC126553788 isoform X1 [Aphis gossypii]